MKKRPARKRKTPEEIEARDLRLKVGAALQAEGYKVVQNTLGEFKQVGQLRLNYALGGYGSGRIEEDHYHFGRSSTKTALDIRAVPNRGGSYHLAAWVFGTKVGTPKKPATVAAIVTAFLDGYDDQLDEQREADKTKRARQDIERKIVELDCQTPRRVEVSRASIRNRYGYYEREDVPSIAIEVQGLSPEQADHLIRMLQSQRAALGIPGGVKAHCPRCKTRHNAWDPDEHTCRNCGYPETETRKAGEQGEYDALPPDVPDVDDGTVFELDAEKLN